MSFLSNNLFCLKHKELIRRGKSWLPMGSKPKGSVEVHTVFLLPQGISAFQLIMLRAVEVLCLIQFLILIFIDRGTTGRGQQGPRLYVTSIGVRQDRLITAKWALSLATAKRAGEHKEKEKRKGGGNSFSYHGKNNWDYI